MRILVIEDDASMVDYVDAHIGHRVVAVAHLLLEATLEQHL